VSWWFTLAIVFVLDVVWARYTLSLAFDRPIAAGRNAGLIYVLSGIATINFVGDPWLLIPGAIGAFIGTIVGMMKR
jgi:hypothetical protein